MGKRSLPLTTAVREVLKQRWPVELPSRGWQAAVAAASVVGISLVPCTRGAAGGQLSGSKLSTGQAPGKAPLHVGFKDKRTPHVKTPDKEQSDV